MSNPPVLGNVTLVTDEDVHDIATAIYSAGDPGLWLRTADASANAASWDYARRAEPVIERILSAHLTAHDQVLAAVRALHQPIPIYPGDCAETTGEHKFDPAEEFCRDCPPEFHACGECRNEDGSWVEWPCETARAARQPEATKKETVVWEDVLYCRVCDFVEDPEIRNGRCRACGCDAAEHVEVKVVEA